MGGEDNNVRNRRIEGEIVPPSPAPAPSPTPPPPRAPTPPSVTPPPPSRLEGKFAYRPTADFRSPIARSEAVTCRYGTKPLDAFLHQAAESYPREARDPGFEEAMGAVLHNRGLT